MKTLELPEAVTATLDDVESKLTLAYTQEELLSVTTRTITDSRCKGCSGTCEGSCSGNCDGQCIIQ